MKSVIIEYSVIAPPLLALIIEHTFEGSMCNWMDINEDFFEFSVFFCSDLEGLEKVLAKYL